MSEQFFWGCFSTRIYCMAELSEETAHWLARESDWLVYYI
jgi:hypothetical protein